MSSRRSSQNLSIAVTPGTKDNDSGSYGAEDDEESGVFSLPPENQQADGKHEDTKTAATGQERHLFKTQDDAKEGKNTANMEKPAVSHLDESDGQHHEGDDGSDNSAGVGVGEGQQGDEEDGRASWSNSESFDTAGEHEVHSPTGTSNIDSFSAGSHNHTLSASQQRALLNLNRMLTGSSSLDTTVIDNTTPEEFKSCIAELEGRQGRNQDDDSSIRSIEDSLLPVVAERSNATSNGDKVGGGKVGAKLQSGDMSGASSQLLMPKAKVSAESDSDEWSYLSDESYQFDDAEEGSIEDDVTRHGRAQKVEKGDTREMDEGDILEMGEGDDQEMDKEDDQEMDEGHVQEMDEGDVQEMDGGIVQDSETERPSQKGIVSEIRAQPVEDLDEIASSVAESADEEMGWKDEAENGEGAKSHPLMPRARLSAENEGGSPLHLQSVASGMSTTLEGIDEEDHSEARDDSWSKVRALFSDYYGQNRSSGTNYVTPEVARKASMIKKLGKSIKKLRKSSLKVRAPTSDIDSERLSELHESEEMGGNSNDGVSPQVRAAASEPDNETPSVVDGSFGEISDRSGESSPHSGHDEAKERAAGPVNEFGSQNAGYSFTESEGFGLTEDDYPVKGNSLYPARGRVQDGEEEEIRRLFASESAMQNALGHGGEAEGQLKASEGSTAGEVRGRTNVNSKEEDERGDSENSEATENFRTQFEAPQDTRENTGGTEVPDNFSGDRRHSARADREMLRKVDKSETERDSEIENNEDQIHVGNVLARDETVMDRDTGDFAKQDEAHVGNENKSKENEQGDFEFPGKAKESVGIEESMAPGHREIDSDAKQDETRDESKTGAAENEQDEFESPGKGKESVGIEESMAPGHREIDSDAKQDETRDESKTGAAENEQDEFESPGKGKESVGIEESMAPGHREIDSDAKQDETRDESKTGAAENEQDEFESPGKGKESVGAEELMAPVHREISSDAEQDETSDESKTGATEHEHEEIDSTEKVKEIGGDEENFDENEAFASGELEKHTAVLADDSESSSDKDMEGFKGSGYHDPGNVFGDDKVSLNYDDKVSNESNDGERGLEVHRSDGLTDSAFPTDEAKTQHITGDNGGRDDTSESRAVQAGVDRECDEKNQSDAAEDGKSEMDAVIGFPVTDEEDASEDNSREEEREERNTIVNDSTETGSEFSSKPLNHERVVDGAGRTKSDRFHESDAARDDLYAAPTGEERGKVVDQAAHYEGAVTDNMQGPEHTDAAGNISVQGDKLSSLPESGAAQVGGLLCSRDRPAEDSGEGTTESDGEGRSPDREASRIVTNQVPPGHSLETDIVSTESREDEVEDREETGNPTDVASSTTHTTNGAGNNKNGDFEQFNFAGYSGATPLELGSDVQAFQTLETTSPELPTLANGHEETQEKLEALRKKFLQIVSRLGESEQSVVVAQVLHRLVLAEQLSIGKDARQTWLSDLNEPNASERLGATDADLDFTCKILLLGKSGVGKSATVNSIFGEQRTNTDAFRPSTEKVQVIEGKVHGIQVKVIDTPGLLPSLADQRHNDKILSSVKSLIRKQPPDVVLYVDRLDIRSHDSDDLPLMRTITNNFGADIWSHAIIVLTHASAAPPDGFNGLPLRFETYVSHRCHAVQQTIRRAAGDSGLVSPVSMIENHSASRLKRAKERVLPDDEAWVRQLHLLCFASKILVDVNSLLGSQKSFCSAFRSRPPPLPLLLSSLLQSRAQVQLVHQYADQESESGQWRRSYQKKLWNVRNGGADSHDKVQDLLSGSANQFTTVTSSESSILRSSTALVSMPEAELPLTFDSACPSYRYRSHDITNQWHVKPIFGPQGWDHDDGHDAITFQTTVCVGNQIPAAMSGQIVKGKRDSNLRLDFTASIDHGQGRITTMGVDLQPIGENTACTLRSETRFSNSKESRTIAGAAAVTVLEDTVFGALKLENRLFSGKQLAVIANGGAVSGFGDTGYGGGLEVTLRDVMSNQTASLGLSMMDWSGGLAIAGNLQSQLVLGGAILLGKVNINNRGAGEVSLTARSCDQLQMAVIGFLPIIRSLVNRMLRSQSQS